MVLPHGEGSHSRWVKLNLIQHDLAIYPRLPHLCRGARDGMGSFLFPGKVTVPISQQEFPGPYIDWVGCVALDGLMSCPLL